MLSATGNHSVNLNQSWLDPGSNRSKPPGAAEDAGEKNWPALLILVIILLTIGGNILVIMAVSLEKKLQNATHFFLCSLAVADMLVGILVMPVSLIVILHGVYLGSGAPLCFPLATLSPHCALWRRRYIESLCVIEGHFPAGEEQQSLDRGCLHFCRGSDLGSRLLIISVSLRGFGSGWTVNHLIGLTVFTEPVKLVF
ncbi:hypothetical protein Z043_118115 [Scleropages formosus]|uniref:G-protein coupled receptors family 1 profile domain-containing protein n=1 Tax=Scleropages formosus TaxID=113540 RepID=A0A0P7UV15_SCLFO|nr:hypothetical protein Z043_118115 [Scleropages formosus]